MQRTAPASTGGTGSRAPHDRAGSGAAASVGDSTDEDTWLDVGGYLFMTIAGRHMVTGQVHMEQPDEHLRTWVQSARKFNKTAVWIRSPYSGRLWPLHLRFREVSSTDYRSHGGRLTGKLALPRVDAERLELEVWARGFRYFCYWLPARTYAATAAAASSTGMASGGHSPQRLQCSAHWQYRPPSNQQQQQQPVGGATDTAAAGGGATAGRPKGPRPALPAYVVMSSPYNMSGAEFGALLHHHAAWHAAFGVSCYVVYVEERAEEFAADPRIQAMIAAGQLALVLWQELAQFVVSPAYPGAGRDSNPLRHVYMSQTLVYNHALLALHGQAAVVAVADLDEFLMTPRPMTLQRVLEGCPLEKGSIWPPAARPGGYLDGRLGENNTAAPGAAWLHRALGFCPTCHQDSGQLHGERELWMTPPVSSPSGGGAPQARPHPLAGYSQWTDGLNYKALVLVQSGTLFGVHRGYPDPPQRWMAGTPVRGCAVWMHLRTQLTYRKPAEQGHTDFVADIHARAALQPVPEAWFWPMNRPQPQPLALAAATRR